jgi:hypothetical protein
VREVVGASPEALSDDEAIALALDPARTRYLGEALNLTEHGKLARASTTPPTPSARGSRTPPTARTSGTG